MTESRAPGTLWGIGLGPGDPELVTLAAARRLPFVRQIFVPVGRRGSRSYAGQIVAALLPAGAPPLTELDFPVGADRDAWPPAWAAAAETVALALAAGDDCAFLTEGDPSLYSTFQYLRRALAARLPEAPVQVIPGIPSVFAAAAAIGEPLALGDETLAIVPATRGLPAVRAALQSHDTVAILKVSAAWPALLDLLLAMDLAGRTVWVRRVGRPEMTVVRDVTALRDAPIDYFSLLLVRGQGNFGTIGEDVDQ